ncbi:MAG TPA: choice-of-anchor Q domain-containing protein [Armatimonadota bacterium]
MRISSTVRLLVGLSLLLAAPARAAVVYVNKNASATVHDGKSWGTAFTTVQAAVSAAAAGDEAWVATGTYTENIIVPAATSVSLYGGFVGSEVSRSGRSLGPEATILDGNSSGSVVAIRSPGVTIDGFTIRNGAVVVGNVEPILNFGGGISCNADRVVITNNVITRNAVYSAGRNSFWNQAASGGGVNCTGNDALIANNTITTNTAEYGGGIECTVNNAVIANNKITWNRATGYTTPNPMNLPQWGTTTAYGGGMDLWGTNVTVRGNAITDNSIDVNYNTTAVSASGSGGGARCSGAGLIFVGNIVARNSVRVLLYEFRSHLPYPSGSANGGGVYTTSPTALIGNNLVYDNRVVGNLTSAGGGIDAAQATVSNNTIVGNSATYDTGAGASGGALRAAAGSVLANNIIAANGGPLSLSGVTTSRNDIFGEASAPGSTDIIADPLFMDRANGDFHLKAGSPCIDAGDDSAVSAGETDLDGNPRIRGAHVDIGAYEVVASTTSISLGANAAAPPTAIDGVVYVAGENGKLYALTSPDLNTISGFPVDISATVGTLVRLNSRPAVYYGKAGKAIYMTTNLGHVVKLWPDGKVAWTTTSLNGPTMSTPAVTPDGSVYVDLGLGTTNAASYLFKLDEVTGDTKYVSPCLGSSPATAIIDRSAAIDPRYAYVNASGNVLGSLAVLNQDTLTVRASFAPGEDALAPFLNGQNIYVATKGGTVYKVNGITMSADMAFGTLGSVKMGEAVTAGPFLNAGSVYVGSATGKVWKLDAATGSKSLFLDGGTNASITGLLATRGVMAFGTANGTLQQVSLANPSTRSIETLTGPPAGGPVYDAVQNRFIIATTAGQLYSVPAI